MSRHSPKTDAWRDRTNPCFEITDKIITELEAGRVAWVQPWGTAAAKAPLAMSKNASTGRTYSGINVLLLWGPDVERGFGGQSWLIFGQALSLGGNVREGERGTTVVYVDRFGEEQFPHPGQIGSMKFSASPYQDAAPYRWHDVR